MRKLIISVIALSGALLLNQAMAQSTLENRFGEDAIASIQGTEKLAILEFQNENGYAVQDLSGKKDVSQFPDALEIEPIHESTPDLTESMLDEGFQLFAYDFPTSGKTNNYYRVGNTGKLLVVYSIEAVKKLYSKNANE